MYELVVSLNDKDIYTSPIEEGEDFIGLHLIAESIKEAAERTIGKHSHVLFDNGEHKIRIYSRLKDETDKS